VCVQLRFNLGVGSWDRIFCRKLRIAKNAPVHRSRNTRHGAPLTGSTVSVQLVSRTPIPNILKMCRLDDDVHAENPENLALAMEMTLQYFYSESLPLKSNTGLMIGLSVGLSAGVGILAILFCVYYRRRRRRLIVPGDHQVPHESGSDAKLAQENVPSGTVDNILEYSWTTGHVHGISHECFIASGTYGEVHKVRLPPCFQPCSWLR
jgi:hypothetical protein